MDDTAGFAFEHAPVGLMVTRHRLIEDCSPSLARMFGYSRAQLIGQSVATLYPSTKEFADVGRLWLAEFSGALQYRDNRIMKRRNGAQFWCQVHGQSTTPHDPFAHCVWAFVDISAQRPVVKLTPREREIAMLLVEGLTNRQIGARLDVSHRTVEAHRSRMMRKLEANSSAEMFAKLAGMPS